MAMVLGKIPQSFIGKIAWTYLWTMIVVFVTFLLAKIIGAPGELFFTLAYYLLMLEIFGLPIASLITFQFFANLLMPNVILPFLEWVFGFIIGIINFITFRLMADYLSNPFAGARWWWTDVDVQPLVTMLLEAIETFKIDILG